MHAQFKRAKERVDTPNDELFSDLSSAYNVTDADAVDPAILKRLAEKLQLMTTSDLKQESLALHELVVSSGGVDPGENIEKMSMLLKKIKILYRLRTLTWALQRILVLFLLMRSPKSQSFQMISTAQNHLT